ncbi:Delta 5 fatty acid desaturase [Cronobacter dublinensis 582]|nr:Delta 5 fatty acid desaturase [Cronobacter dublinensis 582]
MVFDWAAGWAAFIFSKLGHLTLMLGLPLVMGHDGGLVLGLYLLVQMCTSLMVVFLLLGTHWADAAFYEAPAGENPVMAHGWYYHNFMTACDWHTPQRWQEMLTGGLNYHLTHHLFPGWHHRHLFRPGP